MIKKCWKGKIAIAAFALIMMIFFKKAESEKIVAFD